jgi:hypothetical protein
LVPTSTLLFQTLSPDIFFFSTRKKQNKTKKEKTIEKKRNAKKGENFPSSSRSALSLLAPAFTLPLLPFCFKCFFLASSASQIEENKTKQRKKTHREEKNAKKGTSFPSNSCSALSLFTPASVLPLLPFYFKRFLLASSCFQAEEKKNKEKKM